MCKTYIRECVAQIKQLLAHIIRVCCCLVSNIESGAWSRDVCVVPRVLAQFISQFVASQLTRVFVRWFPSSSYAAYLKQLCPQAKKKKRERGVVARLLAVINKLCMRAPLVVKCSMDRRVLASCYCCYHPPGIPVAMVTVTLWILHWRWSLSFWDVACTLILVRALVQLCNDLILKICYIRFERTVFVSCCECRPVTGCQWCVCSTVANPRWASVVVHCTKSARCFQKIAVSATYCYLWVKLPPLCCGECRILLKTFLKSKKVAMWHCLSTGHLWNQVDRLSPPFDITSNA